MTVGPAGQRFLVERLRDGKFLARRQSPDAVAMVSKSNSLTSLLVHSKHFPLHLCNSELEPLLCLRFLRVREEKPFRDRIFLHEPWHDFKL